jgi:uncharacterized protein
MKALLESHVAPLYIHTYTFPTIDEEKTMAVEIKYVVTRGGVEKMTFASKKEADAYDKLLDTADELMSLLGDAPIALDTAQQESLAFYLAEQRDLLQNILRGGKAQPVVTKEEKSKEKPLKSVA